MKIKKFEGKAETEILQRVKDELGAAAIILSIKRKPHRGLFAFFKPPLIVVTAAYEEKTSLQKVWEESSEDGRGGSYLYAREQERLRGGGGAPFLAALGKAAERAPETPAADKPVLQAQAEAADQRSRVAQLERKLTMTEGLLEKVVAQLNVAEQIARTPRARKYENSLIQTFYEALLKQHVTPEIAERLLTDVDAIDEQEKIDIPLIVKIVYNTIISILGEPETVATSRGAAPQHVVFMGPTGVGKTTTIAKLSSILSLDHGLKVGLVTADTYRIAAVEQLKTYAEILGLAVQVVFANEEIAGCLSEMDAANDCVLIDTAGRSHRNELNLTELKDLLDRVPDCKRYLVLSAATQYEDLLNIVNTYAAVADFDLIFTKLDETATLGTLLNICYQTGCRVSYVTFGQNVPEDIEIARPDLLAKSLLGLDAGLGCPSAPRAVAV